MPLALELAASWVRALSVSEIEAMLGAGASPNTTHPPHQPLHHRSLDSAMEWSLALLSPGDQELFLSSSVFRGPYDLEDAHAVLAPRADRRAVAAQVARLVDASLLLVERRDDGRALYRMLVPIREFARRRFVTSERQAAVRDRFVSHFLSKAAGHVSDVFRQVVDLSEWTTISTISARPSSSA